MNEKIINLALDAGLLNYVDNETPKYYFINGHAAVEEVESFAELIIKDSLVEIQNLIKDNLKNNNWTIEEEQLCHKIMCLIRTKYGVERT